MALSTLSDLKASVASWLNREDEEFINRIPDFVALAEQHIAYGDGSRPGLRTMDMEKVATLLPDGNGGLALPDDFLELRTVDPGVVGYREPVLAGSSSLVGLVPISGTIRSMVVRGNSIVTDPANASSAKLYYYAKIPALMDANPTNWLLTKAPGVYLYATLLQTAPFEQDDARLQVWGGLYAGALAGLQRADKAARFANGTVRVRSLTP